MKRILCILLAGLLMFFMVGCKEETAATEPPVTTPTEAAETTVPAEETTEPAEITEPAPTEPEHSLLYLEGVPVENVILWFNEVVLDTEFSHGGDATLVQKWETPILYTIHGDATPEDLVALESFAARLNDLEGFPGMYPAQKVNGSNLHIHFTEQQNFPDIMGQQYAGLDGAVTFWYDGDNRIYDEIICIRTDMDQETRNSVILEEIYNGLGPVQDTEIRTDSLIWQGFSIPQDLALEDWLILQLLYHPDIRCGMNAEACETVIRSLYY